MKKLFQPFATVNKQTVMIMMAVQVVITLLLWHTLSDGLIPKPAKVAGAFIHLLGSKLLLDNILVSLLLTLKAMLYSILITLLL